MDAALIRRLIVAGCLRLAFAIAAGLAGAAMAATTPEVPPARDIEKEARELYWWGDFDGLEALYAEVDRPGQWVADKGTALGAFRSGVDSAMSGRRNAPDAFFIAQDALTLAWARARPDSPLAQVMYADALVDHGWSYRGKGFVKEVPPLAWKEFRRYLQLALDHLVEHRDTAFRIGEAHVTLINLGRAMDWDDDRLWAIAREGLSLNPEDIGQYHAVMTSMLPKWGGSARTVDRFIVMAAEHVGPRLGDELYARLYSAAAAEQFEHALFENSGAEWPRMKAGMEALQARLPSMAWRNRYAYLACLAQDKATFLDQMDRIGDAVDRKHWGNNPVRTIETCRTWAAKQ